jgi:deoxyribonuclease-4
MSGKSARVGMHIRLATGLQDVLERAQKLQMPWFQSFLINQKNECLIVSEEQKKDIFVRMQAFEKRYVHASYWINLCNPSSRALDKALYECSFGLELGFTHMVLHPGAVLKKQGRQKALEILARNLEKLLARFPELTILLENAAHKKRAIGGSLQELAQLKNMVSGKCGVCIDTAHAYVYGYDLTKPDILSQFIHDLDYFFPQGIDLLHLNDASHPCGSQIDCHVIPGKGLLGFDILKQVAQASCAHKAPIILEVSCSSDQEECELMALIENWGHHNLDISASQIL